MFVSCKLSFKQSQQRNQYNEIPYGTVRKEEYWICIRTRTKRLKVPSGKHHHNYGKSPCLMGKSTTSMAMFNSNPPSSREISTAKHQAYGHWASTSIHRI